MHLKWNYERNTPCNSISKGNKATNTKRFIHLTTQQSRHATWQAWNTFLFHLFVLAAFCSIVYYFLFRLPYKRRRKVTSTNRFCCHTRFLIFSLPFRPLSIIFFSSFLGSDVPFPKKHNTLTVTLHHTFIYNMYLYIIHIIRLVFDSGWFGCTHMAYGFLVGLTLNEKQKNHNKKARQFVLPLKWIKSLRNWIKAIPFGFTMHSRQELCYFLS